MSSPMHLQPMCLEQLTGRDDSLIDSHSLPVAVHQQIVSPFLALQEAAREAGFDMAIASGYRGFERQMLIWNDKALGRRPVLDSACQPLDIEQLTPWQRVQAILRWSALPGASRHHWGTDLDIYDRAAVAPDYALQLSAQEVQAGGPFAPLHDWLDRELAAGRGQGFFRPYAIDRGGIAPERWHLSYAPIAAVCQSELSPDHLIALVSEQPLALKDSVLEHFDEIYQRFIEVPADIYPADSRQVLTAAN